ncbi:unnamed protein product [Mesocestoides corti]|uniref:Uncharacterized protein n=1 Tax=Mesocestoides corti TaxID=53468 RepID=A0A0R3U7D5_MESCO|nr:unnamed protein product [Mesocestoides corti]
METGISSRHYNARLRVVVGSQTTRHRHGSGMAMQYFTGCFFTTGLICNWFTVKQFDGILVDCSNAKLDVAFYRASSRTQ